MWKLWHKLFGWGYVSAQFGWTEYIRRVHTTPNGKRYIIWCGNPYFEFERRWTNLTH